MFNSDSYCFLIKSSGNYPCDSRWQGGKIFININGLRKKIIPSGFTEFEYCLSHDEYDVANDRFQLQSSNNNDVCIESLYANGTQIFVGTLNDQASFIMKKNSNTCQFDKMVTSQIMIQNGQVKSSKCKSESISVHVKKFYQPFMGI